MKKIILLLLLTTSSLSALLQEEDMPSFSFNRVDLEMETESTGRAIVLEYRFLEPTLDHKQFASRYLQPAKRE